MTALELENIILSGLVIALLIVAVVVLCKLGRFCRKFCVAHGRKGLVLLVATGVIGVTALYLLAPYFPHILAVCLVLLIVTRKTFWKLLGKFFAKGWKNSRSDMDDLTDTTIMWDYQDRINGVRYS